MDSCFVMIEIGQWLCQCKRKSDASNALNQTVQEYGIPEFGLHADNAGEESGNTPDVNGSGSIS